MITTEGELIAELAQRTGCGRDALFAPVAAARIQRVLSYPLDDVAAEQAIARIIEDMTRALETGVPAETDPASRYVWLQETVSHYQSPQTRKVVTRVSDAGRTPAVVVLGADHDPLTPGWEPSWGDYDDDLARQTRQWRRVTEEAGVRESWRMPSPYARADSEVPIDAALDERDRTGDVAAYRDALKRIRDAEYRDVDAWAHSGHEALARADTVRATAKRSDTRRTALLDEALGFYQTAVAVGELSLPARFTGMLPWSCLENRPFHRARHGLALAWWRLGDFDRAATVLGCSLWIDPHDHHGVRELLPLIRSRTAYHHDLN